MGIDITSYTYPFQSMIEEVKNTEGHKEGADETIKSFVKNATHPLFSSEGLKNFINLNRSFGNAPDEKLITGDISEDTIKDLIKAAYKKKFPFELLVFAADLAQKLDERSGASDASGIVDKFMGYAKELTSVLGRQPLNSEVFMAGMLESASKVKTILEKAESAPNEKAEPIGSQYDELIFKKYKADELVKRTNKEVYQFFKRRMQVGDMVFPHLPLGTDAYGSGN